MVRSNHPTKSPRPDGFTLIELLLAIAVFGVVLAAINGVFWGALRLRNKTARMLETSDTIQRAIGLIRADIHGLTLPGGTYTGEFKSDTSTTTLAQWGTPSGPELRTTTGRLSETQPWGDIQKVAYYLRPPTNAPGVVGLDLVRVITRNLAPTLDEDSQEQWLLGGVDRMDWEYYDGSTWKTAWDPTTETTPLPRAVRVQLTLFESLDNPEAPQPALQRQTRSPIEIVVPVTVVASTNATTTTTSTTTTQ